MLVEKTPEKLFLDSNEEKLKKEQFLYEKFQETIEKEIEFVKAKDALAEEAMNFMQTRAKGPMPIPPPMPMAEGEYVPDFNPSESKLVKELESVIEKKKITEFNDSPEITDEDLDLKNLETLLVAELKVLKLLETRTLDEISSVLGQQTDHESASKVFRKKSLESLLEIFKTKLGQVERDSTEFQSITLFISSLKNKISQFC